MRMLGPLILAAFFIAEPLPALGQGLLLHTARISGKVSITNASYAEKISTAQVHAIAESRSASAPVGGDGSYSLTVDAPADGSERTYIIYAVLHLKNDQGVSIQFGTQPLPVFVTKGGVHHRNLSASLGRLSVKLTPTNAAAGTFAFQLRAAPGYPNLNCRWDTMIPDGGWSTERSFDFPAGIKPSWVEAWSQPKDSTTWARALVPPQDFIVRTGETVNLSLSCTYPDKPVARKTRLTGTIELQGLPPELGSIQHAFHYPHTRIATNPGSFDVEAARLGTQRMALSSYSKNGYVLHWPHAFITPGNSPSTAVDEGRHHRWSPTGRLAGVLRGTFRITGTMTFADAGSRGRYLSAYGVKETPSQGGFIQSNALPDTGEFSLPVFPGTWRIATTSQLHFVRKTVDPSVFIDSDVFVHDERPGNTYTISDGQSLANISYDVPTGSVKIKIATSDGSLVASPSLSFRFAQTDVEERNLLSGWGSASGPSEALAESQVTLAGPPGVYTVHASAQVNGSRMTFPPQQITVIEGVEQILELHGPSLRVETPSPGHYTSENQVTVSGIANDGVLVSSVMVNGKSVALLGTATPGKPHEVRFSEPVPLIKGPNSILVKAVNSSGKTVQGTRLVYCDNGPPSLSLTPVTPSVPTASILVEGKARDDNAIQQVYVNGLAIPLTRSPDPHEVTFSASIPLRIGANRISVTAVDACKRIAEDTRIVTRTGRDVTAPQFQVLQDADLDQDSPFGTAHVLPVPIAKDDQDLAPRITSDAPDVFLPGVTQVTWTATDASGNSARAQQKVRVSDRIPPVFEPLSDLELEQKGPQGTPFLLPTPKAVDKADPAPVVSSNAPTVFPPGLTTVTWKAVDASGHTATATQYVFVGDRKPPTLTLSVRPTRLIAMQENPEEGTEEEGDGDEEPRVSDTTRIAIQYKAIDALDGDLTGKVTLASVTSDEPVEGEGPDIRIVSNNLVIVTCAADPSRDGRVYTLNYKVSDRAGNVTTATQKIEVRRKPGIPAIDSGISYAVVPAW